MFRDEHKTTLYMSANSFKTIADEWITSEKAELKASSIARYNNILDLYLIPAFGNQPVETICRHDISTFSRDLLNKDTGNAHSLAPKTVNSILAIIKSILKFASREKNLNVVDIKDISVKQPQKPSRILSTAEQQHLVMYLRDNLNPCNLGILICLFTGLRIGEICTLKWEDVSFEEQSIYVHQSMQRVQVNGKEKKTEIIVSSPKSTCSIRRIPIPNELMSLLICNKKSEKSYLITGEDNKYIEPRCMENKFKSVALACGIKDIKFHSLRHTFATRCVELGFDAKSLSEILGHATVNITLNRYVHPSMEQKQKNMNMLSALFTCN